MINNEILSFIKDQLAQGTTKDKVKDMLVGQGGWDDKDVEEAFETINFSGTSYPSVLKNAAVAGVKDEEVNKNFDAPSASHPQTQPQSAVSGASRGAFAPASELMKSVSGDTHSVLFSPGLSHMQQPKSMEPTTSVPASFVDIMPHSAVATPSVSVNPLANDASNSNALGGLRARIASGVAGASVAPTPVVASAPILSSFPSATKEPAVSPSMAPSVSSPVVPAPAMAAAPFAGGGSDIAPPRQPLISPVAGQGGFSSLPSLNKTPMPSVSPEPKLSAPVMQPMSVFPKSTLGGIGSHGISPNPAQLAALQKQKGSRFLLGLMMFLIGVAMGGMLMNAYMNGYINAVSMNGVIEKGMNMIGLGTPAPLPESVPVQAPVPDGGS